MHGIKTQGIDCAFGLKVDDFDKLEELDNLAMNVFEGKEDQILTQLYVSKNKSKNIIEDSYHGGSVDHFRFANDNHEDNHEINYEEDFEIE